MGAFDSQYIQQTVDRVTSALPPIVKRYPLSVAATSVLLILGPLLYNNWQAYLSLGPGGLPYNVKGWMLALFLKLFERKTTTVQEYDLDEYKGQWLQSEGLPKRNGPRPDSGPHIPVRQFNQFAPEVMKQRLDEMVKRLVASNPTIVAFETSPHETLNKGIMIHPSLPSPHKTAEIALREIAHVHPIDHSMHIFMAPQDCKTLITHGWGERHKLSGSYPMRFINRTSYLPKEYVWLYAPRDERELAVVEQILIASIGYMTSTRAADVKH